MPQMTFERLLTHMPEELAKSLKEQWDTVPPENQEDIQRLIDLAYIIGKADAADEFKKLLPMWGKGQITWNK